MTLSKDIIALCNHLIANADSIQALDVVYKQPEEGDEYDKKVRYVGDIDECHQLSWVLMGAMDMVKDREDLKDALECGKFELDIPGLDQTIDQMLNIN